MALLPDQKFSTFQDGGDLQVGDIVVGLRGGINTRFDYTGELPSGVVVPISQGGTGATTASGARTNLGLGTIAVQDADSINVTGGTLDGVAITNSTADLNSGTVSATPTSNTDIANKKYVDDHTATLHFLKPARVASTSNFSATYNNGSSGVGATLTATSNGAATGDGITLSLGDRKLFKDQTNTFENGLYEVTQVGDGSNPAIYTRTTDFDEAAEIKPGDIVVILEGNTLEHTAWLQTADVTDIGTDAITFVQFAADFDNIVTIDGTQTVTGQKTFNSLVLGGDMDANTNKITDLVDPTAAQDAATKAYVDSITSGSLNSLQIFTSSGTWNKPSGINKIQVTVVGAGGGGGGTGTVDRAGGGGGGGGVSVKIIDVSSISSETVTIGTGGSGGSAGINNGSNGGSSSFGSHCSASGGTGGRSSGSSGSPTPGGVGTGGDLNLDGGRGSARMIADATGTPPGGSPPMFGFSPNISLSAGSNFNGQPGDCFGGGGCGGISATLDRAGGNGRDGLIVVFEYN